LRVRRRCRCSTGFSANGQGDEAEQSRSGWVPIKTNETEPLSIGRNSWISATLANALPVVALQVHTPESLIAGRGVEPMKTVVTTLQNNPQVGGRYAFLRLLVSLKAADAL